VKDLSELKETVIAVGLEKVLELLGVSMDSKTALNDVFLPKIKIHLSSRVGVGSVTHFLEVSV